VKYQRYMRDYLAVIRAVGMRVVGKVLDYLKENGLEEKHPSGFYPQIQVNFISGACWFDKANLCTKKSFRPHCWCSWPSHSPAGSTSDGLGIQSWFCSDFLRVTKTNRSGNQAGPWVSYRSSTRNNDNRLAKKSLLCYFEYSGSNIQSKNTKAPLMAIKIIHFLTIRMKWNSMIFKSDPKEDEVMLLQPQKCRPSSGMQTELKCDWKRSIKSTKCPDHRLKQCIPIAKLGRPCFSFREIELKNFISK